MYMYVCMFNINIRIHVVIIIANYILDDKSHTDNVVGFVTATVKHHVSPCLTPEELAMLVQQSVVSTDHLSFV